MNGLVGIIGGGNMGSAIIGGMLKTGLLTPAQLIAADANEKTCIALREQYGIQADTDNKKVAQSVQWLFLAVKPQIYASVIKEIRDIIAPDCVIISIAAGQTLKGLTQQFGHPVKLVRAMPNTPALVGEGMSALTPNDLTTPEELNIVQQIFESFGKTVVVPEHDMDIITAVSGSSPAYVFMFLEAMADAAVLGGMPRDMAYRCCAQAVLGSAKMMLETGLHPGVLKDMVCSPGGTTIEAVAELEKQGMRQAIMSAIKVCQEKSQKMTKA